MRILHTSDWHLGRLFHGASLHAEQRAALERVVALAQDHAVDLVVIAGDLYDRAIPAADAVALLDDALAALHEIGVAVVAISGNHDSAVRVGFGDRLLTDAGVTIRGDARRCAEPIVVAPDDGGEPVAVYAVPYLDPVAVRPLAAPDGVVADSTLADFVDPSAREADADRRPRRFTHDRAMRWAMDRARRDRAARGGRSVVVAHTFVNGGAASGSERELTVGDVDLAGLDAFAGFDYVALGHLHRPQAWCGGAVAYSGSPLPYSFSEEHHTKSVRVVELGPDGSLEVQVEPLAVGRPLRTLVGELDELLADPALADAEGAFVRAVLTDRHLPLQAMSRLQRRFAHAVELAHRPSPAADATVPTGVPRGTDLRAADPFAVSVRFLHEQRGLPVEDAERAVLTDAFDGVRRAEAS